MYTGANAKGGDALKPELAIVDNNTLAALGLKGLLENIHRHRKSRYSLP